MYAPTHLHTHTHTHTQTYGTQGGGMRVLTSLCAVQQSSAHMYAARALSILSREGETLRTWLVSSGGVQLMVSLARSTNEDVQVCVFVCVHIHSGPHLRSKVSYTGIHTHACLCMK